MIRIKSLLAPAMLLVMAAALLTTATAHAATAKPPAKVKYKPKITFDLVAEVRSPTAIATAPGFKRLLFVTSRYGKIRVIRKGELLPQVLLDISSKVNTLWVEQGLLGLAFAPDFAKSGRYYVHYTARNGDIKIDEYKVNPKVDPTRTIPESRRNVLRIPRLTQSGNHNGGELEFVGDLLYIAVGDGNDPGDALNVAQNLDSLRGKILRIDPRPDETTGRTYQIPASNPFVGRDGRDEIFAYGFRNPHSFNFFRPAKGAEMQMVITDVGQGRFEEMNVLPFRLAWGANFGWKMYEGLQPYNCETSLCPNGVEPMPTTPLVWPVLTYSHKSGCAIIGGPYVRDKSLTTISGRIIYGDFCQNRVRTAEPGNGWITDDRGIGSFMPPGKGEQPAINGFGEDAGGRVYALTGYGDIYRLNQITVKVRPKKKPNCKQKPAQKKCQNRAGT